ncbi:MAG: hypothetical protein B6244_09665 [Candidatus Cloacimonetes bacterium 4572_55]|nr:MAG: hypothetical protein B6244_09665 [Candidatus Cloacimonetes bacterium 4572_55]
MRRKKLLFLIFFLSLAAIGVATVDADSNLSGRSGLTYCYATTDNDTASLIIPDSEPEFQLMLLGRYGSVDVTLNSMLHHNKWNHTVVDLFALSLEGKKWEVNLGDFFIIDNPLTVNNRLIRGARFQFGLDGQRRTNSKYRLDMFVGESNSPEEKGDRLDGLYNQRATSSTYRRVQWMGKATAELNPNLEVRATYAGGKDIEESIDEERQTSLPLENHVVEASVLSRLLSRKIVIHAEAAHSQTDSSLANSDGVSDEVYRLRVEGRTGNIRGWARWQRVGADFYSTGYPYLARDREGPMVGAGYSKPNFFLVTSEYEQYKDNLNDDQLLTVTTDVIHGRLRLIRSGLPNISFSMRYQSELSPSLNDSVKIDRSTSRAIIDVTHRLTKNLRGNMSFTLQNVDDQSLPDTSVVQVSSDEQTVSVNFSGRFFQRLTFSPGMVYNKFKFPDLDQTQKIFVGYSIVELEIIPTKLRWESDTRYTDSETASAGQSYTRLTWINRFRWYFSRSLTATLMWKLENHDVESGEKQDYQAHQIGMELIKVF